MACICIHLIQDVKKNTSHLIFEQFLPFWYCIVPNRFAKPRFCLGAGIWPDWQEGTCPASRADRIYYSSLLEPTAVYLCNNNVLAEQILISHRVLIMTYYVVCILMFVLLTLNQLALLIKLACIWKFITNQMSKLLYSCCAFPQFTS